MADAKVPAQKQSGLDIAAQKFHSLLFPEGEGQDGNPEAKDIEQTGTQVDTGVVTDEPASTTEPPASTEDEATPSDEATPPQPDKKTRKVRDAESDEVVEVDEDEAENGYLRLQDYTRKTQAAAKLRKEAEAEAERARVIREQYAAQLEEASAFLDAIAPKEPNWTELRSKLPPDQYIQVRDNWDQVQAARKTVETNRAKVEEDRVKEFQEQYNRYAEEQEEKLVQVIPEWADPAVAIKGKRELVNWLLSKGYEKEEVNQVVDHRLISNLRNAMLYEKAKGSTPPTITKPKGSKTVPVGSGTPPAPKKPSTERDSDMARLRKTGKISDAAVAFKHFVE